MNGYGYEYVSTETLSPQARRLVQLVYNEKQSMEEVLRNNPDLMAGVDQYMKWYGETESAIAEETEAPPAGHTTKEVADKLKKK